MAYQLVYQLSYKKPYKLFDSHLHIIESGFPLIANAGFTPNFFSMQQYLEKMRPYNLLGGAVVSGSFQAFDQSYLIAALKKLGPSFVGVTQLPVSVSDNEIMALNKAGVRGLRFNLLRGGSAQLSDLDCLARRVYDIAAWHCELYADAADLLPLYSLLCNLPSVSIDHLGLSKAGLPTLLMLAEQGVRIKATGFGRVDFDNDSDSIFDINRVAALRDLHSANPAALMFGSDLPSTRAPRPFLHSDITRLIDSVGEAQADAVLHANAAQFYRITEDA